MMPLGEAFYRRKVAQIQEHLDEQGLDGMLLLDVNNVMYASGFIHTPSERPIGFFIPTNYDPVLFVPLLEQENAADTWITDIRTYFEYPGEEYPVNWMVREIISNGLTKLVIDDLSQRVFATLPDSVVVSDLVDRLRWVKDPEELEVIRQAARYADYCLEQVRDHAALIVRDGGTELDILRQCISATSEKMKAEIGEQFRLRKAAVVGTVHSGPRAALPHGSPMTRKPRPGETLIAGIGASVAGYHAESGATFVIGEPSGDTLRCLQAAEDCNLTAIDALVAGATCASVNVAALDVLRQAGLGDAIRHRIGHGMGIQGHEAPWLAPGDETILVPNMVFSNEPGIYRPGVDGYRTINTMIVTDDEAEVPSQFLAEHPPQKRILPL